MTAPPMTESPMTEPPPRDGDYVCHGVTWATGDPRLLLAPIPGGELVYAAVMHRRLGFTTGDGRWCTGRYEFTDTVRVDAVACPQRARVEQGAQCARCLAQDDFRFAHHAHRGGHTSEALRRYLDQPHWLYLATFADATTKIGTAAHPRRRSRLDEQGAVHATYLTRTADGHTVRHLEDALSQALGVRQTVRAANKLTALSTVVDLRHATAAHDRDVALAVDALTRLDVTAAPETWEPPTHGARIRTPSRHRALYPHDLRDGPHGFTPAACLGTVVLADLTHTDDGPPPDGPDPAGGPAGDDGRGEVEYLLDLQLLRGRRITVGRVHSPATATQSALF